MPSNSSGSYFRYLYFTVGSIFDLQCSVVVLLPAPRQGFFLLERFHAAFASVLRRPLAARLGRGELARLRAADALERAEPFEHEVDRGRAMRRRGFLRQPGVLGRVG